MGASKLQVGGELLKKALKKQMDSPNDLLAVCNKLNEDDSFKAKMVNKNNLVEVTKSILSDYCTQLDFLCAAVIVLRES